MQEIYALLHILIRFFFEKKYSFKRQLVLYDAKKEQSKRPLNIPMKISKIGSTVAELLYQLILYLWCSPQNYRLNQNRSPNEHIQAPASEENF